MASERDVLQQISRRHRVRRHDTDKRSPGDAGRRHGELAGYGRVARVIPGAS